MSRIQETFATLRARNETGLIAFLTAGYPDLQATLRLVPALIEGGADIIELGIPFSDPLADGTTIQRASYHALQQGVTPADCLALVSNLRQAGVEKPLVLMGYYNPILAYGTEAFARAAAEAGADGLIVVDLPAEESSELVSPCRQHGLDFVPLVAPTSTDSRIAAIAKIASGFIYCVSVTGVTGARQELPADLHQLIARVRAHTPLPIAIGFGISRPKHFQKVRGLADAAVIGSAIIQEIDSAEPSQREQRVREYVEVVTGHRRTAV
ncbi:MAG TPA: tryptophan synthase subunit alpha [Dehalococcoidia bacterium]|nr:tryptophan synthase subunit alpha [Dehalococcoidia bacterium]